MATYKIKRFAIANNDDPASDLRITNSKKNHNDLYISNKNITDKYLDSLSNKQKKKFLEKREKNINGGGNIGSAATGLVASVPGAALGTAIGAISSKKGHRLKGAVIGNLVGGIGSGLLTAGYTKHKINKAKKESLNELRDKLNKSAKRRGEKPEF